MNIKTKTFLSIFPVVVICLFLFGFSGVYFLQSAIRDTFLRGVDLNIERLSEQFSTNLRIARTDAQYLTTSEELRKFIREKTPRVKAYQVQYRLNSALQNFLVDDRPYRYLSIYSPEDEKIAVASADKDPFFEGYSEDRELIRHARLSGQLVHAALVPVENESGMSVHYKIIVAFNPEKAVDSGSDSDAFHLLLDVNIAQMLPTTEAFSSKYGYSYNLADSQGRVLLTDAAFPERRRIDFISRLKPNETDVTQAIEIQIEGASNTLVARKLQDIYLLATIPENRIKQESDVFRTVTLVATVIGILLIALLLLQAIDRTLIKPIRRLKSLVVRESSSPASLASEKSGEDELHQLGQAYSEMLREAESHNENLERTVTERTRELSLALGRAQEYDRAKSQFLANMSHEIRTPMNGIIGMVELLKKTPLSEQQQKFTEHISNSSAHLLEVVNDILDLSRIEAGKFELVERPFQLETLIGDTVQFYAEVARRKGLTLELKNTVALRYTLIGDAGRLRQVLVNLLGNSIKFTEKGGIVLEIALLEDEQKSVLLRFSVADTGIGIDSSETKKIFDSFSQADASSTRQYGGSGLGLAISRQLVELLGGEISVESELGHGSTFHFTASFTKADPADLPKTATHFEERLESVSDNFAGKRILLCEDNEVNQEITRLSLERMGCEVEIAGNGMEGINFFENENYDLILMDCQMPIMDGYGATQSIRNIEQQRGTNQRIPIVALTAHAMKGDSDRCIAAGMDDYVSKPFTIEQLAAVLSSAMH